MITARSSSIVLAATLFLSPNLLTPHYSNAYNYIPRIQNVKFIENNSTPVYYTNINAGNKSRYNEALELFGEVRGFTKEEAKLYEESLSRLFVKTGDNFFDL